MRYISQLTAKFPKASILLLTTKIALLLAEISHILPERGHLLGNTDTELSLLMPLAALSQELVCL
jgi:hypothetical protein